MQTLAQYIASYISEEIDRGAGESEITADMIDNAIDAYNGGAGDMEE